MSKEKYLLVTEKDLLLTELDEHDRSLRDFYLKKGDYKSFVEMMAMSDLCIKMVEGFKEILESDGIKKSDAESYMLKVGVLSEDKEVSFMTYVLVDKYKESKSKVKEAVIYPAAKVLCHSLSSIVAKEEKDSLTIKVGDLVRIRVAPKKETSDIKPKKSDK